MSNSISGAVWASRIEAQATGFPARADAGQHEPDDQMRLDRDAVTPIDHQPLALLVIASLLVGLVTPTLTPAPSHRDSTHLFVSGPASADAGARRATSDADGPGWVSSRATARPAAPEAGAARHSGCWREGRSSERILPVLRRPCPYDS